jgi:long-chain acyl-CoA synthetase
MSTLSEIIAENARKLGAKPCVIIPGSEATLTYEELDQRATRFAQFLAQSGCTRGSRVLIAIHNTPESFVALVGTMRAAMVAIPIDSNLAAPELQKIITHAEPALIVVDDNSVGKLAPIEAACPRATVGAHAHAGVLRFDAAHAGLGTLETLAPKIDPSELALILYTSGTTGLPKGVMHSHAGLAAKLVTIQQWFKFDASYRSLCLLPTHFGHGLICNCLATLNYGGTLVLCRPFDLDLVQKLWRIVEEQRINTFSTVPAVVRLLLRFAERSGQVRVPSLRFVTCASAPLRAEDVEAFESQFGVPLLNCFGITETASWTAFSPRDPGRDKASVGIAHGCEIRAVDDAGKPLPPGQAGELQVRGPSVMLGYYKNPELTAQTIKDGWFCTGDHGKVDGENRVFILGRIKELIIRAGLNVYPADVDAVLLSHPEVAEAYSVGLEDKMLGEKVVAAAVRKEGSTISEQDLIAHCRANLAGYKCPERICFVDAIPKTSRGKVNRANLRPLFAAST